jgi:hypothetical protein
MFIILLRNLGNILLNTHSFKQIFLLDLKYFKETFLEPDCKLSGKCLLFIFQHSNKLKIAECRTPTPQDVRKEDSKILKLPVRNCFTLTMINKLVVIINSIKYQKLRKFYYMK